ncbi:hypothetical protein SDRG_10773 [Saprolegnia diclina VS20]|uniref:Uncharacterized protein n=1 Tax=Saprolegnia diclina (strain VS20) TaxID=1156394 RepID=T0QDG1_SAPDV|nr:hypothetical protein SDRG_10773 [Saprolegnia diclina VS20]EQC31605.1 hypothetical protein SDRG_10773 [Saprolegnia diclina VS20]|eukprot:XP_008615004.1 hypothetical protein SDRG_10773 [Saprolegnia diclina VS20]
MATWRAWGGRATAALASTLVITSLAVHVALRLAPSLIPWVETSNHTVVAARTLQRAWRRYRDRRVHQLDLLRLRDNRALKKPRSQRKVKATRHLTKKEVAFKLELELWVTQVLLQLHPRTVTIPLAFVPEYHDHCLRELHSAARFKIRRWLCQRLRLRSPRHLFNIAKARLDCAARLIQGAVRCRFAYLLLAAKRRYLDGLVFSMHVRCLGHKHRAALVLQATWRYHQSVQFWRHYLCLYRIRLVLMADAHRRLRYELHELPFSECEHPKLLARWVPRTNRRARRPSLVAITA